MAGWHIVDSDDESYLFMLEIEGGTLYKTVDFSRSVSERFGVAMIFVPDKEKDSA